MPPPTKTSPEFKDVMTVLFGGLVYAFDPKGMSPREALVAGRAFVAEVETQYPGVIKSMKEM